MRPSPWSVRRISTPLLRDDISNCKMSGKGISSSNPRKVSIVGCAEGLGIGRGGAVAGLGVVAPTGGGGETRFAPAPRLNRGKEAGLVGAKVGALVYGTTIFMMHRPTKIWSPS